MILRPGKQGVVAAGHPLTAEAGAAVLREGGNAVDAALCGIMTSFAVESPLTGFGAGGFMLIHLSGGEDHLLDFFVAHPGSGADLSGRSDLVPISVMFDQTPQVFNIGAAACGVYGNPKGVWEIAKRYGSVPLDVLAKPAIEYARNGCMVNPIQAYIMEILDPILTEYKETRELYAPEGRVLREGETFKFPELADALELLVQEGPDSFYTGETAKKVVDWVCEHGGTITMEDLAAYEVIERTLARADYRGREVLTNPPPSSGGILIAYCLNLIERHGGTPSLRLLVEVMEEANRTRTDEFNRGLREAGYLERFLSGSNIDTADESIRNRVNRTGSTTHISVIDREGNSASVTCSNGTGCGIMPPGTAVHLNNMLGEEDLNPLGFHVSEPGLRVTSMMAPTAVVRGGEVELTLGSAGSNRLRSAILQTVINVVDRGLTVEEAVNSARAHIENDIVDLEPGFDQEVIETLKGAGYEMNQWQGINLYFGGVQACARDPENGVVTGAGDPRRGGAVAYA